MERDDGYNDGDGYEDDDGYDEEEYDGAGEDDGGEELEQVARSAYEDGHAAAQASHETDRELDRIERKYPALRGNEELQETLINEALAVARRAGGLPQSALPAIIENVAQAHGLETRGGRGGGQRDAGDAIVSAATSGKFRLGG